jgi:hypothetical protein
VSSIAPKFAAAVVVAAAALFVTGNAYAGSSGGNGGSGTHIPIGKGTSSALPPTKTNPTRGHPCTPQPGSKPCPN